MSNSPLAALLRLLVCWTVLGCVLCVRGSEANSTYYNPVLPGWHSDPSCTRVNQTFFCVTSTFDVFPGLPIYASRDLLDWRLVSHGWNRESQLPAMSKTLTGQQNGHFAATIRYHEDRFFLVCVFITSNSLVGVVFNSTDPYDDAAWSVPVRFGGDSIDPDLFWDDDGKVYMVREGIVLQEIGLATGELSPELSVWNGTGGASPEGPHLYKKDGLYYLLIAEGGTELNHSITIARSANITGPYEAYENNPILTARGTDNYFQTVGHGDLFQDSDGNWWGLCLATRSGPEWDVYPMGREAVLFPVTWNEGEWPILQEVQGRMSGWHLPERTRDVPGDGPFLSDPDRYDFSQESALPRNLVHFRVPEDGAFTTTAQGLRIAPSRNNLTGEPLSDDLRLSGQLGVAFVGRRQTDTLFTFSADFAFRPVAVGQEVGVTIFLEQLNHIDLGIVLLASGNETQLYLRARVEAQFVGNSPVVATEAREPARIVAVPGSWADGPIRLQIRTVNATHYSLSAMSAADPGTQLVIGTESGRLVSGGNGTFVGSLVGAYATCNGAGSGSDCPDGGDAYVSRWWYTGEAQYVYANESVPSSSFNYAG